MCGIKRVYSTNPQYSYGNKLCASLLVDCSFTHTRQSVHQHLSKTKQTTKAEALGTHWPSHSGILMMCFHLLITDLNPLIYGQRT